MWKPLSDLCCFTSKIENRKAQNCRTIHNGFNEPGLSPAKMTETKPQAGQAGESVLVQHHDKVACLTLNRAANRNALSGTLLCALYDALLAQTSSNACAVIITGAGDVFSAGGDFTELTGTIDDLSVDDRITKVTDQIRALPIPVIAAVNGPCLGGAVDIALSCDVRIASENAWFQIPATRLGLLYNPASVRHMVQAYGKDLVFRLLVMGERFDADSALSAGLVASVVQTGGVHEAALSMAGQTGGNLRDAVAASKALLNAIGSEAFDAAYWEQIRRELLSSESREKAISAAKSGKHSGK
jgi:enoyl-CoA hydratase/carnithine racemase